MASMSDAEKQILDDESRTGDQRLLDSGHLIAAGPLAEPETATLVRVRDGMVSMTDGPYVETKEHLGGIIVIEAESRAQAIELLAKDNEIAKYGTLEIREHWPLVDYTGKGTA
jgi:hypothetical protein